MKITPRSIIISLLIIVGISGPTLIVLASILSNSLGWLIVGVIGLGVSIVFLLRVSANPISVIVKSRLEIQKEHNRHIETAMARGLIPPGYTTYKQMYPELQTPKDESKPSADPRHALLVSLCRITIRSKEYGPTSPKLMTADDAQADISGLFKDRMNWDGASKYGQGIGFLYTQTGGKPAEQGLKIHGTLDNGDPVDSAADLLVALHEPSLSRRAAIAALPQTVR